MSDKIEFTIAGVSFGVADKYAAGHVITEGEASALNQTRRENIRNNFAKKVAEAKGDADELDPTKQEELQALIDAYASEYEFGVRTAGAPRVTDPVEREALAIVRNIIRANLKAKNQKADADVIAEGAAKVIADKEGKGAKFWEMARRRVEEDRAAAEMALDETLAAA